MVNSIINTIHDPEYVEKFVERTAIIVNKKSALWNKQERFYKYTSTEAASSECQRASDN